MHFAERFLIYDNVWLLLLKRSVSSPKYAHKLTQWKKMECYESLTATLGGRCASVEKRKDFTLKNICKA